MIKLGLLAAAMAGVLGFDDLRAEIDRIVLSGRSMPKAMMLDVRRLPSASERMLAIAYLRRSGLLSGTAVDMEKIVFQWAVSPNLVDASAAGKDTVDED